MVFRSLVLPRMDLPAPAFLRLPFLPVEGYPPTAPRPEACLSLASGGDMRYLRDEDNPRRGSFFRSLGLDPGLVRGAELFHTRRVLVDGLSGERLHGPLPAGDGGAQEGSHDGIILRDRRAGACVTVADCMPIWLYDAHSGSFGVLHSGWKGTGILAVALRALSEEFGSPAAAVSAILGPAVGPCCYPVPGERAESFAAEFGPASVVEGDGRPRLDLRAANIGLARSLGLGALLSLEACTSCDGRLGSYRRQGPETFTRMAALAAFLPGTCPSGCLVAGARPL